MERKKDLYPTYKNPFIIKPTLALPEEMAVIGAGTIGPDIGYYLRTALPDKTLYLVDIDDAPLKKAEERYRVYADKGIARKKLSEEQARLVLGNIVFTTDYDRIGNCGLVIEAATENLDLKRKIFDTLEGILDEKAIITSNTSSIPADQIFTKMRHPERSTVTHFFAPAWRSLAVEVIDWEGVDRAVIDDLFWFFARTGKAPVITDNVICFMLNRIFENWVNEAGHLIDIASAAQIDHITEEFVSAGPFFVINEANGNPIIVETNRRKMQEGEYYRPAPVFRSVEKWAVPRPGAKVDVSNDIKKKVRDRMLGIVFSQAFDIVDRGIGTKEDLNFGCMIALGFKKGPFDMMKDVGEAEVKRIEQDYQKDRPGFPRAGRPFSAYQDFNRYLLIDETDGVKIITIRRPQAMNALNEDLNNEVLGILKQYESDPAIKGFVITGYGDKAFCAGADIGNFPKTLGNKEAAVKMSRKSSVLLHFMDQMDKPVVAAINGMALGGGLELAIRCHAIVALHHAWFQFPEITLGIMPGIGGCVVPYRKWPGGASLFNEMICSAKRISIREAADIGMVQQIKDDYGEMIEKAVAEVERLQGHITPIPDGKVHIPEITVPDEPMAGKLRLSREAVAVTVKTIKEAASAKNLSEALEINYQGSGDIACTNAAREGITAFLEKRKPVYKD